jgi:hypothetical protein
MSLVIETSALGRAERDARLAGVKDGHRQLAEAIVLKYETNSIVMMFGRNKDLLRREFERRVEKLLSDMLPVQYPKSKEVD